VKRRAAAAIAAVLALSVAAHAYNDDPSADTVYPAWRSVRLASPVPRFNTTTLCCEVYQTGFHAGEVHWRNLSDEVLRFDFWIPGWQHPRDNARVTLPPYFEARSELKLPLALVHGRPGISSVPVTIFDLVRGTSDDGPREAPLADAAVAAPPDEDWMPAWPLHDDGIVRRSNLAVRFVRGADRTALVFRNPSVRDLHFVYEVPALVNVRCDGRVTVLAGRDTSIPLPPAVSALPLPLLRVLVRDVRVGDDTGKLYAEDRNADAGWFPLVTGDGSAALPHDGLLAVVESADGSRARVRFRSRMRSDVRLRFRVPGYQDAGRDNDPVTVAPGSEASADVVLDRAPDARLPLTRLAVFEVSHRDGP
jgi:hypothetical protein